MKAMARVRVDLPQTAAEWADEHFYLSEESSGSSGKWTCLPFQVGLLNMMGSSDIQRVDVIKSARVGFTKSLMAVLGYFLVKKRRSVGFWQPTDSARDEFTKTEIEPAIRDVPSWVAAFPAYGKKSKHNTLEYKAFIGASLWLKGGTSAGNYRRISPDVVMIDELDAFPLDIDEEGTADALTWKRTEVSSFRKQIKGSSPKKKGSSQIEDSANKAKAFMRYHVQCPHCGELEPLEWGGARASHGLKWKRDKPETVHYLCKHCGEGWENGQLHDASVNGHWADAATGYVTKDGLAWTQNGVRCSPPRHVAIHLWTAYSPFSAWREIVEDWIAAQGDPLKLKAFINTTLGETYEATDGQQVRAADVKSRPSEAVPEVLVVTLGIDTQPDRWELQWLGHSVGGDMAVLGYEIIPGETDRLQDWKERLTPALEQEFVVHGRTLKAEAIGVDTGGLASQTAYDYCALQAGRQVLAMKGFGGDRPVIDLRPSKNWRKKGLDGWVVGVNAAKDVIMSGLARRDGAGRIIFPEGVELPPDYADQVTAERRVMKITKGRKTFHYEKRSASARNEALDTLVYGYAAFKWLQIHRHLDLESRASADVRSGDGFDLL